VRRLFLAFFSENTKKFNKPIFLKSLFKSQMHEFYAVLTLDEHIPTHIIYFDNLVSNSTKEMESLLNFFNQNFGFYPEDAPKRLDCLNKENFLKAEYLF
jgi:hypothetical protein